MLEVKGYAVTVRGSSRKRQRVAVSTDLSLGVTDVLKLV